MIKTLKLLLLIVFVLMFVFSLLNCLEPEKLPGEDEEIIDDDGTDDPPNIEPTLEEIIADMLSEQEGTPENPAVLTLDIEIGSMTDSNGNWHKILKAIETSGKYVDLDLSACSVLYKFFNPDFSITDGKNKIIKITLPDETNDIIGVTITEAGTKRAFINFTKLEYVNGKNITHIGSYAFYSCTALKEADFPNLTNIDIDIFSSCKNLTKADFPLLVSTGDNIFYGCINLKTVNLPELTNVRPNSFYNCSSLETAYIPKAVLIDQSAFYNCTNLTEADFPLVETLGNEAFRNCESLTDATFPFVKTINPRTFMDCIKLEKVSFATAEKIGNEAFKNCINLETAAFLGNPEKKTFPPNHPLDPWRQEKGLFTEDCFVIYDYAFYGCKSLEVLDIRNAWNIYFAGGCLADIGTHLDMYLFDDDGKISYGHPPIDFFLGGGNDKGPLTLISMKIYIPKSGSMVQYHHPFPLEGGYHGIAVWVNGILGVTVNVEKLP